MLSPSNKPVISQKRKEMAGNGGEGQQRRIEEERDDERTDVRASGNRGGPKDPCPQPSYSELRALESLGVVS
jgi:hypothetical protein